MFKKNELHETLTIIARHDGLPSRDILTARDRMENLSAAHAQFKRDLQSVQRNLDVAENITEIMHRLRLPLPPRF